MMMSTDALRTLAVILAVAIVAAPYWRVVARALKAGGEWVRGHAASVSRLAAAALILAAAWGKVPIPTLPTLPAVTVEVEPPSPALQATVAPIAVALRGLPMGSRMTWAATWNKAALVVAGEATAREVALSDTRALQAYTALALDIAWRRIGGNQPGSQESLRKALEAAYASEVGTDDVPTSAEIRARYVAFAKAVAWAGINGG